MATELTFVNATATSATVNVTNIPAGGTYEVYVADNPQFRGLVSFNQYAANAVALTGLNQRGTYYARARGVTNAGVRQPFGEMIGFTTAAGNPWDTAPLGVMVMPAMLVVPEPILRIASVSGAPLAGFPIENLLDDDPGSALYADVYADQNGTTFSFDFDTAGAAVDTIALLDTDLPEGSMFSLVASTTAAKRAAYDFDFAFSNKPARASPNLPQRGGYHLLGRLPQPQEYRFWRMFLHCPNGTLFRQARVMARYLVIGRARTAKNISTDKIEQPLDLGAMDRNRAGGPDRTWGHKMRKIDFEISVMSEMQWETQFSDLWRKIGLTGPILVLPNSRTGAFLHDRILFGTVASARSTQVNSPIHSQAFSIESII